MAGIQSLAVGDGDGTPAQGRGFRPAAAPGEILVQFKPGATAAERAAILSEVGGQVIDVVRGHKPAEFGEGMLARIAVGPGITIEKAIQILSKRPGVQFAEPNYVQSIEATSNDPIVQRGDSWGMYGDETSPTNPFGSQSGEAWARNITGSRQIAVGVVDSGIDYTHVDLYLNIWLNRGEIPAELLSVLADVDGDKLITFRDLNHSANAAFVSDLNLNGRIDAGDLLNDPRWENGIDDDGNGYVDDLIGWDFGQNDNDPYDVASHGTHVAGTIGAIGGNGKGVAGVNWSVQIVALNFMQANSDGSVSGLTSSAIKALDYFTAAAGKPNGLDFAATNNSWGGGGYSQALLDSIVRSARADILFVAAAGNGGGDGIGDDNDVAGSYPANYSTLAAVGYEAVLSVASIKNTGALSSWSNFGSTTVHLAAPGEMIASTVPGDKYAYSSGTSMAAPHVTGAIALYSSIHKAASAAQIRSDLLSSTASTPSLEGKVSTGGRLDVMSFVANPGLDLAGSSAADTLVGGGSDDRLSGLAGADLLRGEAGNDALFGGDGNDTLDGGAGNDSIDGGSGLDTASYMSALAGVTVSLANNGAQNTIGAGIDTLLNIENLTGSRFDDVLTGNFGDNVIEGGDGNDVVFGLAGNDTLNGGAGDDELRGGGGDDVISGEIGDDNLFGGPGNDMLSGGEGNDTIAGGADNDTIFGNVGDDSVDGTNGNDTIFGGDGNDTLRGQSGDDSVEGGIGNDSLFGGPGTDVLLGGEGNDMLGGGADNDMLFGNAGNDWLDGGFGDDALVGGDGNDTLFGGGDDDRLFGGEGDDILMGEVGRDELVGGAGRDVFVFRAPEESVGEDHDSILDFTPGEDKIDLSGIDADTKTDGDQAFTFVGSNAFTGTAGQLRAYEDPSSAGRWFVEGDTNGDGAADFQFEVRGSEPLASLNTPDFIL